MENAHYLPHEVLKITNYPELSTVAKEIDAIRVFAMRLSILLADYNEGQADKISVDVEDLRSTIGLCRTVCDVLGRAPNVCFDVLAEIRTLQIAFHDVLFAHERFGSEYVGTPSAVSRGGIG